MQNAVIDQDTHPVLKSFVQIAPYLQLLVNDDITIGVYDTEKLLINIPAKTFSLNVTPGDPLLEGDIITNAIRENKNQAMTVPAEVLGVDLVSRAIPVHDEQGRVIGGVGVGLNVDKANKLSQIASNLSSVIGDVTNTVQEMAESVNELATNISYVSEKADEVTSSVDLIEQVSAVVKNIADQSNLLGLNAAIESARAGEHGRGFGVVADEIRKMATNSKDNVQEIQNITSQIKEVIEDLGKDIQKVNLESTSQSASIEELTATMEEINVSIRSLAELAKENIELKN
ncbi:methyl-accepting chemotaxis protein [Oceanobacillus luteolus]|uniref:Methyl-accepting chemotaxis protein n=1 Tax=Oceanobacillus luteolus TaxID=1274358 RepID=A0ABW4HTP2_9BACI|nr:methyl-accepting chemotaxis protein [Oceanobacillus luteolus]MCM3741963.1 methyl-accepting chemotaxis protein [Oceanobacillus luteolus]